MTLVHLRMLVYLLYKLLCTGKRFNFVNFCDIMLIITLNFMGDLQLGYA